MLKPSFLDKDKLVNVDGGPQAAKSPASVFSIGNYPGTTKHRLNCAKEINTATHRFDFQKNA